MKPYRENVKTVDLAAYRAHGYIQQDKVTYGIDWLKVCGWLLAVGFSLSMWIVVLLAFLYWRA